MQHQPTNFDAIQIIRDSLMAPVSVHREKRRIMRPKQEDSEFRRKSPRGNALETRLV